ncbi:LmbU family transcriptional regulator [Micromonospora rubida]|uniref:LmbU family transcriptional regulator n=1 Tax=Micromonospora rubida TaxID=2697657 RepID=UPI001378B2BA|nr:LmbU family transcriptional regulator [Micromonospora rubida]NBE83537.1 antibiotic biosynthesis protein [Micromonospora rubida]
MTVRDGMKYREDVVETTVRRVERRPAAAAPAQQAAGIEHSAGSDDRLPPALDLATSTERTRLDYQTLRNYAWVARCFTPSRRRPMLTFQHHMEVAALPEEEQDHWLDFAQRMHWSRNELRKQLRASVDNRHESEAESVRLQLQISPERMERWETAAARHNCTLADWMAHVLDRAVQTTPPSNALMQ